VNNLPEDFNIEALVRELQQRASWERDRLPADDPRRGYEYWWELMCDYGAPPLWRRGALGPSPVTPESLELPAELCRRIWAWDDEYNTGQRDWSESQFCDEGWGIALLVAHEVGRPVEFKHDTDGVRVALPTVDQ
jgi:hypothetical protein